MGQPDCQQFLERHRLLLHQYDAAGILDAFLDEMRRGLSGQASSLAMIPSYIPPPQQAPRNRAVIAVDAGGTHFRTTLIRFDEDSRPRIEYRTTHPMPGADGELSKEQFFDRIADHLEPVLGRSDRLAFCFSYPAAIDRERDGRLLYWTKEIQAPQVVGEKILANLDIALQRRGLPRPAHRLILNDTVAALLAGCAAAAFEPGLHYVGFILGTGTNTAYIERNGSISKVPGLPPGGIMTINCESANFNRVDRGDIDLEFDQDTTYPGKYVLEKMVSGAYLGRLTHRILRCAAAEGVVSTATGQALDAVPEVDPHDLGRILTGARARTEALGGLPETDIAAIRTVTDAVVERAALLTAVHMAAPVIRSAGREDRARADQAPVRACISADGSVYFKLPTFRERAEAKLSEILGPRGIEHTIVHVEEATLIGTAVAGLA